MHDAVTEILPRLAAVLAGGVMLAAALSSPACAATELTGPNAPMPRASFTVGGLEMVMVLAKDRLYAFVDGVEDNAPANVDHLSVEIGKRHWAMNDVGPGLYMVAPFTLAPGHQPMTVEIAASQGESRVDTALDIAKPAVAGGIAGSSGWLWWAVVAAAGLALAGVLGGRRFGAAFLRPTGGAG